MALSWPLMVSFRPTVGHDVLNGVNLCKKFLFGSVVPRQLVEVVVSVAQQRVGWRSPGGLFHQTGVRKRLKSV